MYLMIPETVLSSFKLTAEEKILVSYMHLLEKSNKYFFGDFEYIEKLLGIFGLEPVFDNLGERGIVVKALDGYHLSAVANQVISGTYNQKKGSHNGKSNFYKRDIGGETGGHSLC